MVSSAYSTGYIEFSAKANDKSEERFENELKSMLMKLMAGTSKKFSEDLDGRRISSDSSESL